jgi:hypothetical protein
VWEVCCATPLTGTVTCLLLACAGNTSVLVPSLHACLCAAIRHHITTDSLTLQAVRFNCTALYCTALYAGVHGGIQLSSHTTLMLWGCRHLEATCTRCSRCNWPAVKLAGCWQHFSLLVGRGAALKDRLQAVAELTLARRLPLLCVEIYTCHTQYLPHELHAPHRTALHTASSHGTAT